MSSLLIASTLICFSGYFAPVLIKYLIAAIYSKNKADLALRAEMRMLEKEMAGISVVNEFAKFTRLERRHTKLKDELRVNASERLSSRNKTQLYLTYGNKVVCVIISLILMYAYGKEPVIVLPDKLLWPFQSILRWPATHENAISLTAWMILTRMVVDTYKHEYS